KLNQLESFELFLIKASRVTKNSAVELALSDLIEEIDGKTAAQAKLYQQLNQHPTTFYFTALFNIKLMMLKKGEEKKVLCCCIKWWGTH
ncbi:tetratricopeptide repeat protein, partial [Pasteurella multocida subsp. multocida str. Anand1_buffalo]